MLNKQVTRTLKLLIFPLFFFIHCSFCQSQDSIPVVIRTELGDIHIILYHQKAPITSANFLKYIDSKSFHGGSFYRTVKPDNQPGKNVLIEVIQGGVNSSKIDTTKLQPIDLERTNKTRIKHKNGTISMARDAPNTASTEFFICIGDQPSLDFGGKRNPDGQGFAAFGRVVSGMDIVTKIQKAPSSNQALQPPVKILQIKRE